MDVSSLSVCIDVDMSAFMEAMNKVTASLLATAATFKKVSLDIAAAFSNIKISVGETESPLSKFIDKGGKVADMIGLFEKIPKLGPWGTVAAAGVAGLSLALDDTGKSAKEANDKMQEYSNTTLEFPKNPSQLNFRDMYGGQYVEPSISTAVVKSFSQGYSGSMLGFNVFGAPDASSQNDKHNDTYANRQPKIDPSLLVPIVPEDPLKELKEQFDKDYQSFYDDISKKNPPANANIHIDASAEVSGVNEVNDGYKQLGNTVDNVNKCLAQQSGNVNASADAMKAQIDVSGMAASGIDSMVDAVAQVGQKGANPMKTLVSTIAGGMKSFGKQMIEIGIGKQLLVSLGTVAPPLLIAGGIALELAADVAMNSLKMASGGIVSGSTFANIGEYAGANHNPEVVAPLDKLQSMIGGNMHHMEARISGDDLVFVTSRVSRFNQNSTGGSLGNY